MLLLAEFFSLFSTSLGFWITNPITFILPTTLSTPWTVHLALSWTFLVSAVFCWIMSLLTGNLSQIDRLWSVLPPLYSLIITLLTEDKGGLNTVLTVITGIWGSRLTLQFIWKGGYTLEGEDYRWAYVKDVFGGNKLALHIFNLFFIVIYQSILLLLLITPQIALLGEDMTLTTMDTILAVVFLFLVVMETLADRQQQAFQHRKHSGQVGDREVEDGFVQSGLWAYCRHPNFLCEILIWWVFAMVPLSRVRCGWSVVGAVCLTGLFTGSQDLTEQISASKYPEYRRYQETVPAFIPSVRMMTIKRRD
eukprot:sb/3467181/